MAEEMKINNLRLNVSFLNDSALLSDEELGRLVRYGLHYVKGDADYATLKGNEYFLAPMIERYVEEDNERYTEKVEKNKKNASMRWHATASERMQTDAKDANTNTKSKSNTKTNINKERNFVPPTLSQVTEYCTERNNKVDPEQFVNFYESKGWKVGNQSMKDWKAAVRTWEQREKGIQGRDVMEDTESLFYKAVMKMGDNK